LEGGIQGTLDTQYSVGEILLPVASREDVVFVVPHVGQGQILTMWTLDYPRTGGGAVVPLPTVPVAHFRVVGAGSKKDKEDKKDSFTIAVGTPLLTNPAVNQPTENIKNDPVNALIDSSLLTPPEPGSTDPTIILTAGTPSNAPKPGINNTFNFIFDEGPTPPQEFTDVPHVTESRWAAVGDLVELTISNSTNAHHPWHPHGFSIQPVRFTNAAGTTTLFTFPYNEFVDVVDIPPQTKFVYRVRLTDRPLDFNTPTGGAVGRWAMHCHIFFHAGLGMITELVAIAQ
jgi:FtsP/CotA-like multicopper oxidase with cupredoxin domain